MSTKLDTDVYTPRARAAATWFTCCCTCTKRTSAPAAPVESAPASPDQCTNRCHQKQHVRHVCRTSHASRQAPALAALAAYLEGLWSPVRRWGPFRLLGQWRLWARLRRQAQRPLWDRCRRLRQPGRAGRRGLHRRKRGPQSCELHCIAIDHICSRTVEPGGTIGASGSSITDGARGAFGACCPGGTGGTRRTGRPRRPGVSLWSLRTCCPGIPLGSSRSLHVHAAAAKGGDGEWVTCSRSAHWGKQRRAQAPRQRTVEPAAP